MIPEFKEFGKIARLSRDIIVSEKIDGTNAQIYIDDYGEIFAGSRNRWLIDEDNFGFGAWVKENKEHLLLLGPGRYYGEWCGAGVGRRYNMKIKKLAFFYPPKNFEDIEREDITTVPVLYLGPFCTNKIDESLEILKSQGSLFSPGFMKPEGIVIFHTASQTLFKKTIEKDSEPKSMVKHDNPS